MTKDDALKLAIEALETNIIECRDLTSLTDALIACKVALENKTAVRDYNFMRDLAIGLEEAELENEYIIVELTEKDAKLNFKPLFDANVYGKFRIKLEKIYD